MKLAGEIFRMIFTASTRRRCRETSPLDTTYLRRYLPVDGGAYTFGGGKGLRTGSGLSLARITLSVRMRGEKG
jgi:hypothetical protein